MRRIPKETSSMDELIGLEENYAGESFRLICRHERNGDSKSGEEISGKKAKGTWSKENEGTRELKQLWQWIEVIERSNLLLYWLVLDVVFPIIKNMRANEYLHISINVVKAESEALEQNSCYRDI